MNYSEVFALRNKYKELVTGMSVNIVDIQNKDLKITDVIVTPYGLFNKVCIMMKENLMNNEAALKHMQKTCNMYAIYVVNTEQETLLDINLLKFLVATNQLIVA
ncbi:hypothetical protein FRZ67_03110 [Panacibacter ginsenosidivorans]|uniref:Uncharacterized protein n=1 Tax=Panacibacter ginsenosidivorans TaxID=1813871 RepID=A0A5B8V662_9BACT|nr:hypothetical protein [Panacibacter ginsenosidivorans]QEC66343.1 hypothetical protein FRZ67_03110 [Panacibacter ginsenosidivorans]